MKQKKSAKSFKTRDNPMQRRKLRVLNRSVIQWAKWKSITEKERGKGLSGECVQLTREREKETHTHILAIITTAR